MEGTEFNQPTGGVASSNNEPSLKELRGRDGSAAAELTRIRNSSSFRLGVIIITAFEKPLRFFRLPWDLLVFSWEQFRRSKKNNLVDNSLKNYTRSILFISGESKDFYRQERTFGLIDEILNGDSGIEIAHLRLGPSSRLDFSEMIVDYSLPSSKGASSLWGGVLTEQVELLISVHRPALIVYDGEYPHRGLIRVIKDRPGGKYIWIQPRPDNKKIITNDPNMVFSSIVNTRDLLKEDTKIELHPPLFWSSGERAPKTKARSQLGITATGLSVLFNPPPFPSDKQKNIILEVLNVLSAKEAILCMKLSEASKEWLQHYPLKLVRRIENPFSKEFVNGFDFGICDGSEPVIYQMIDAEIPFISIPRLGARQDFSFYQSKILVEKGCVLLLTGDSGESVGWVLKQILNPVKRRRMRSAASHIDLGNGLVELAEWLIDEIDN